MLGTVYLVLYNSALCIGWAYLLYLTLDTLASSPDGASALYARVVDLLEPVQSAAVLEIVHCAVGLVRSGVFATTLQVFSRIGIVWGILRTTPEVQTHGAMASLLIMWSLTEVVRYAFYTVQLLKVPVPAALLWVRYSLFIVAYPVGITSELVLAVLATPHIQKMVAETDAYSIRLPNAWNFGLDYYWLILCCLLLYVPGAPFLYKHMLKQRKSKLTKLKAA